MTPEHFRRPAVGVADVPAPAERSNAGPPVGPCSLRVEDASGAVTWHALELDAYDVGRDVERGIRLASRDVSRLHARLERDGAGRWWVAPQAERASTLVNGKPARDRRPLTPWDDVQLGGFHLRLVPREATAHARDRLRELLMPFVDDDMLGLAPPARVRIYEGSLGGHDVRLDKGVVVFGSGGDATVALEGRRYEGVCVEFRAVRGGFEVVDRSERPSLTVNGAELRRFELTSDELVGIGDVERQRKDGRDALRVRFLPNERRPGQETTPAPGKGTSATPTSSPAADVTARTLGAPGEASGTDTDPGMGPLSPDVAPRGPRDTAVDLVAPHEPPSDVPPGSAAAPPTWPDGAALGLDESPTSRTVRDAPGPLSEGPAGAELAATRELPLLPPTPPSRPPSGVGRGHATEPPPGATPSAPPAEGTAHSDAQSLGRTGDAGGQGDADARGGPSSSLRRAGLVLASLALGAVLLWLWWRPSTTPGVADSGPRPTASDVATNVPGPPPTGSPAGRPPSAPTPPPEPPRRAPAPPADTPTTTTRAPAPARPTPPTPPTPARPRATADEPAGRDVDSGDGASEALRRRLEAKAAAGRASREELNELLTVCVVLGNTACVQRARGLLARQEGP